MHPHILYAAIREEHARRQNQARLERQIRAARAGHPAPPGRPGLSASTLAARVRAATGRLVAAALRGRTRVA